MNDLRLLQIIRSVGFEVNCVPFAQWDTPGYQLLDRVILHSIHAAKYTHVPRLENGMFLSGV